MKIEFNEETSRAARLAFVTTHRAVNLTLEPHKWDDWRAAVQVFEDSANAQVELPRYSSGDQQRANAQHEVAPIKPGHTFEMGKWYCTRGAGYAQVMERNDRVDAGGVHGHLLVRYKVGLARTTLEGLALGGQAEDYHLTPGAIDQGTMAFEREMIDKLRETLKSAEQRRAAAEHDRGVWQRKAEHAETSLRDTKILVNEAQDQRDHESVLCKQAEAQSVGWRTRAEGAESRLVKMNAAYSGLMVKLADKLQTILRAEPDSELIRGGQRAAYQLAQHVGLNIRPKVVAPVMVTWSAPDTTNT